VVGHCCVLDEHRHRRLIKNVVGRKRKSGARERPSAPRVGSGAGNGIAGGNAGNGGREAGMAGHGVTLIVLPPLIVA
jgi:hypothetical protein